MRLAAMIAALLIATCMLVAAAQQLTPERREPHVVVFTPSYFKCAACEPVYRHAAEWQRPGAHVSILSVSESAAKNLGITAFPTLVVGETVVGFGVEERARIKALLDGYR